MKTEITKTSWEEEVFESRNKEYGAYSIRKSYDENVSKASLIALLFAAFVFAAIQRASLLRVEMVLAPPTTKGPDITLPPIIITDPPASKRETNPIKKATANFLPVATTNEPVETLVETVDTSPVGDETGTDSGPIGEIDRGSIVETSSVSVKPIEIFNNAEVMPEYDGGTKAMIRFISRNMHYPTSARVMGQEGMVYVRFVVNSLGQIVDVEVFRGVSAVLDREAMRVIALMNKWKPGLQHNLPVNVRMVLPIKFQLE